MNTHEPSVMAK